MVEFLLEHEIMDREANYDVIGFNLKMGSELDAAAPILAPMMVAAKLDKDSRFYGRFNNADQFAALTAEKDKILAAAGIKKLVVDSYGWTTGAHLGFEIRVTMDSLNQPQWRRWMEYGGIKEIIVDGTPVYWHVKDQYTNRNLSRVILRNCSVTKLGSSKAEAVTLDPRDELELVNVVLAGELNYYLGTSGNSYRPRVTINGLSVENKAAQGNRTTKLYLDGGADDSTYAAISVAEKCWLTVEGTKMPSMSLEDFKEIKGNVVVKNTLLRCASPVLLASGLSNTVVFSPYLGHDIDGMEKAARTGSRAASTEQSSGLTIGEGSKISAPLVVVVQRPASFGSDGLDANADAVQVVSSKVRVVDNKMVVTASDKERMVTLQTSGFDGCDIEMDCAGSTLLIVEVMRFMTRYNPDRGETDFVVTCGSEANLLPAEFYERQRKPIPKTSLNKLNVVGMKHINKAYATRIGRDSLRTFWIESGNGGGYCNGNQLIPVRVQNGGQQLISDALKNAQPLAINAFNEWLLLGYGSQTLCDNPEVAKYVAAKQLLAMMADGMEAGQAMSIIEDARERMARFVMLLGGRRHDTYTLNGILEPPSAPEPAPNYN